MTVLITGASGLIGAALVDQFRERGTEVRTLVRREPTSPGEFRWDPAESQLDTAAVEGVDAVIHLAGENLAAGRWTAKQKRKLVDSRIRGTRCLALAISRADAPPKAFLSGSAIGIYGNRREEWLEEDSPPGGGFLADLCREWEGAADAAQQSDVRVVFLRTGVVLSGLGGALLPMLPPFRFGLGGRLGTGAQYFSWISHEDTIRAILHCLDDDEMTGPVNLVGPAPVTNSELTRALGKILGRPTVFTVPAFGLRLALGEMADEILLAGQRVRPTRLQERKFEFQHQEIESAVRAALAQRKV